jgi:hypothetical protein
MSRPLSVLVRVAFYLAVLMLAAVRWQLNPPLQPLVAGILAMWGVTAGLFFWLRPRGTPPGPLPFLLDFAFFFYEATAVVLAAHLLGGTGWLTLLLLTYPTVEFNRLYPGHLGLTASFVAILGGVGIAVLEAVERLPHDPFYSVGDPLYREPLYLITLLVLAMVLLVGIPAMFARAPTHGQSPR